MAVPSGRPVRPGGPNRYDHYNQVLFNAFQAQMPGSIRRLKASKPIAVRTRKIVAAMLALGKFDPDKYRGLISQPPRAAGAGCPAG